MTIDTDIYTEIGEVRYLIGDVSEPYLLDGTAVQSRLLRYPTLTRDNRVYFSALDCLKYLLSKLALTGSSRRREREGGVEIEEYGGDKYKALRSLYDDLVKNPPSGVSSIPNIHFGGVSKAEVERVRCDPDSESGSPFRLGWTREID